MLTPSSARSASLRALMADHTVVLPGAINALSARLIERMGFEAIYLSGAVLANSVGGVPDVGLMTLTEAEKHAQSIAQVTTLPIIADADTGFGEKDNTIRTIQVLEHAGVSGVHLEDQVFPKRCGHLEGKQLVSAAEFGEKIAAASAARHSEDFLLIARTDARSVDGYDAAVARAQAYLDAGADAIFPEALRGEDEFRRFAKDIHAPLLANMTEFGATPYFTVERFADMGYNLVIFPVTLQRVAMKAMESVLQCLKEEGSQERMLPAMQTRQELYDLLGYEAQVSAQRK
ncbi:MAG: methylisocitrate lyase [Candidatus Hydrogenedentes bacterium]|nr:methylisocitrate lyase [Candidatus Hydrogenedentota bacterium]